MAQAEGGGREIQPPQRTAEKDGQGLCQGRLEHSIYNALYTPDLNLQQQADFRT